MAAHGRDLLKTPYFCLALQGRSMDVPNRPPRRSGYKAGPINEAACWSHSRRKFFELADLRKAPLATEAVRRIDELFAIEREINGMPAVERLLVRRRESRPIVADLENWMRAERARLSRHTETAEAI